MPKAATIQEPHRQAYPGSAGMFDGDLWDDHHHLPGTLWLAKNRLCGPGA
jgi:hypothetical protein